MTRIRVALVNDYMLVVRGMMRMLEPYADRIEVVELDVRSGVSQPVDIALYDTFTQTQVDGSDVDLLLRDPDVARVAVYTWNMHRKLIAQARDKGLDGYLSKSLSAAGVVDALVRIHDGEMVVEPTRDVDDDHVDFSGDEWPGRHHGLSPRQAEVLALVTQGLSNDEISKRAYLSVNTVKSYLRQTYRIIGVTSRSQAILWGLDHGLGLQPQQQDSD